VRFVSRQEELLGRYWPVKTRWLSEATLGDFTTRCRWECARQPVRDKTAQSTSRGLSLLDCCFWRGCFRFSDSFPTHVRVDLDSVALHPKIADTRESGGWGTSAWGSGATELSCPAETASCHGPSSGLGFISGGRLSHQWLALVQTEVMKCVEPYHVMDPPCSDM
jgi:hypothetical protein